MSTSLENRSVVSLKNLIALAGPILLANVANISVGTIDTIMVGQRSANDLAGVALGASIALWVSISFTGMLQGVSPIAGYAFGAKTYRDVGVAHQQSLYLALLFTIPAMLLTRAVDFWVTLADVTPEVGAITKEYLRYVSWAVPAVLLSRVFTAVNASVSRPAATTLVLILAVLLKVPLNALMMDGVGDWAGFGGKGVGIATVLMQWFSLFALAAIWHFDRYYESMRITVWERINFAVLGRILRIGVPTGLSIFFEISSFSLMSILIARMGTAALGAHQIVSNLIWLYYDLPLSVGIAGSVLVAQNLGRQDPMASRRAVWMVMRVAAILAVVLATSTWLLESQVVALYSKDAVVQQMALVLLPLGILYHLADAMQCSSNMLLRGYRITVVPMILHSTLLCGMGLGLGLWFANVLEVGVRSYWLSMTMALWIEALILAPFTLIMANRRAGLSWKGTTLT